jgi:hypothetical protein
MAMAKTFVTSRATPRLRCSSSYTIDEYALAKSSIFIKEYVIESHKKKGFNLHFLWSVSQRANNVIIGAQIIP